MVILSAGTATIIEPMLLSGGVGFERSPWQVKSRARVKGMR
jgi:hypothetical protein